MKKFILIIILSGAAVSAQTLRATGDLFSPTNVKSFADYLFCTRDYLRAVGEYQRYLDILPDDSVKFKIGIAYSRMAKYSLAAIQFSSIKDSSLMQIANIEYYKSLFQDEDFPGFRTSYSNLKEDRQSKYLKDINRLYNLTYLFTGDELPTEAGFLRPFNKADKNTLKNFYDWKKNPPYKSPLAAAIMSAIIPGSGKIYTEHYGDGIMAFLSSTVLGYIAYTDFKAGHNTRGWIFTAAAAGFYAGNIYGSAASAQIYNAQISFDFRNGIKLFLEKNNYYTPTINYCGER